MSRVGRYSRSRRTPAHAASPTGLSPAAATRSSDVRLRRGHGRGVRRPLPTSRSTPGRQRQRARCAARVWAPPRSLAATRGILSLPPGTEMFQFPGCPLPCGSDRRQSRPGCPIRTPPDRRLPAPPRGVSPRGRVLPRPPTPRHPPCALLRGITRTIPRPPLPPGPQTGASQKATAGRRRQRSAAVDPSTRRFVVVCV